MAGILAPVNLVALWFVSELYGVLVAMLAVGDMVPNLFILIWTRGLGPEMAIPHLIFWPPLLALILWLQGTGVGAHFALYFWVLFAVDLVSVAFDLRDTVSLAAKRKRAK